MPIPRTRAELVEMIETSFDKLRAELDAAGTAAAHRTCVEDWTLKDLLAVRVWWTESVVDWIEAGRRGETPDLPATGYAWTETPRLNADIVRASREQSYSHLRARLERGVERVLETIASLDEAELLDTAAFDWAGKWPLARWISINTARQYTTARTFVRRASKPRVGAR